MTTVEVFLDQAAGPRLVGQAHFTRNRGQLATTFIYSPSYLSADGMNIDPGLALVSGAQHKSGLFGAFADSAPDRWGRNLIQKAERSRALKMGQTPRHLDDLDFLLGVSDDTRQGALRFRIQGKEDFMGEPARVPQLIALPELLRASDELGSDDSASALKQLLDTGTTGLGGARPKASVRLDDGDLAIAKFPHGGDRWDVMAWEATALDVMAAAGLVTPEHRLTRVGDRSVLLLRRFDRGADQSRIGYISAMTATESSDGDSRDYVDIAAAIRDLAAKPRETLHNLFDRVIVSVALRNTDDHLRNHGFLATQNAWQLSPAFDVNPNPDIAKARATTIAGAQAPGEEVEGLLALAQDCDLTLVQARRRMGAIASSLAGWQEQARKNGIAEREIAMMSDSIKPQLGMLDAQAQL